MERHVVHIRGRLNRAGPAASLVAQLPDWLAEVIAHGILKLRTPGHWIRETWFPRLRNCILVLPQTETSPQNGLAYSILNSFRKYSPSCHFEWCLSLSRTPALKYSNYNPSFNLKQKTVNPFCFHNTSHLTFLKFSENADLGTEISNTRWI